MVKEFGREKHFTLSLPRRTDLELLADALSVEFGCAVVWNEEANRIAVKCPEKVLAMAK